MTDCLWCIKEATTTRKLRSNQPRECPECGHVFRGNGWDGIDAHWNANHAALMPYKDFWSGILKCSRDHHAPTKS